ncbi:MAG TPA: bifunctional methylenetetrahydrofolate dehydrogenase/methenyltetrahydrofolate cyclohydrolase FolD [Kofleriaceae bacterium]|nr:bifunctional methylenetetrahydrofolate dehydrogenase/methenyltetrahydrofolate cyclohydrolase FolD [Kofleriaceae bacterium]
MTAKLLDGKALAAQVKQEVAARVAAVKARGVSPGLAVVLVGDDPASAVYVRSKAKDARECGIEAFDHKLPADVSQATLLALVAKLAADPVVHGILVQLPLPRHLDSDEVIAAIPPHKDVDGLHPENLGRVAQGRPRYVACTPQGCMRLLELAGAKLEGANAVVLGRSVLVGKPVAYLLSNANATVTLCHSKTKDLPAVVAAADVVIAAIGRPEFVRGEWIKPGAVVIDVGINRLPDGKLIGDVEYAAAAARASAITPVPGGVGPMTRACLLSNTVLSAEAAATAR